MTFNLGRVPETFTVTLVEGADFIAGLRRTSHVAWPGTLEVSLAFNTTVVTTWDGDITDDLIQWNKDEVDVDALILQKPKKVKLWYVDGPVKILWATGSVVVKKAT